MIDPRSSPCRTVSAIIDTSGHTAIFPEIVVSAPESGEILQQIIPGRNIGPWWDRIDHRFLLPDMNADGYDDIVLRKGIDSSGNHSYYFWLFDPATGLFVEDSTLESSLNYFEFAPRKRILSFLNPQDGCRFPELSVYEYIGGKLTLVEVRSEEEDPSEAGYILVITRRPINGKMVTVGLTRTRRSP